MIKLQRALFFYIFVMKTVYNLIIYNMKKTTVIIVIATLFVSFCSTSCNKEDVYKPGPALIEGLTLENFPVMDGSTSTYPLTNLAAARLLGYDGGWVKKTTLISDIIETNLPDDFVKQKLLLSQTHGSFVNLIDGGADLILSARRMSNDEKDYADKAGVKLIETPIALDALVFIKHADVNVKSLTHQQLEDIYTIRIKNWNEVGGKDLPIVPFVRNKNSGSQELMESLVMTEPIPDGFYQDRVQDFQIIISMAPMITSVGCYDGGLGYAVYYYLTTMGAGAMKNINLIEVEGIFPHKETIADRSYPFTSEVYAIIRSDLDQSSMAYKVYEFMQTSIGKQIIEESGYVPN